MQGVGPPTCPARYDKVSQSESPGARTSPGTYSPACLADMSSQIYPEQSGGGDGVGLVSINKDATLVSPEAHSSNAEKLPLEGKMPVVPVFIRLNVLDIMDISNANTFKVKLYFEACWDAPRANKLAEFFGAATYDETEKSFKRKGDIWGLLGVKDYNKTTTTKAEYTVKHKPEENKPRPIWDPNLFFPNLISVESDVNEWDQYDDDYQAWSEWDYKDRKCKKDGKEEKELDVDWNRIHEDAPAENDVSIDAPKSEDRRHTTLEKVLTPEQWKELNDVKRAMFSRRVIAIVTFKYNTDLSRFPMDMQELWITVRSRTAEGRDPKMRVLIVQNPHVKTVIEKDEEFSHPGKWSIVISRFHFGKMNRKQVDVRTDKAHSLSVYNSKLMLMARREVDVTVRLQSVAPFFLFTAMAYLGLWIPVESIDQRMGFFGSIMIAVFTYQPDIHPKAKLRTTYEEDKLRVLLVLCLSVAFTILQFYWRYWRRCDVNVYNEKCTGDYSAKHRQRSVGDITGCLCMDASIFAYIWPDWMAFIIVGYFALGVILRIFNSLHVMDFNVNERGTDKEGDAGKDEKDRLKKIEDEINVNEGAKFSREDEFSKEYAHDIAEIGARRSVAKRWRDWRDWDWKPLKAFIILGGDFATHGLTTYVWKRYELWNNHQSKQKRETTDQTGSDIKGVLERGGSGSIPMAMQRATTMRVEAKQAPHRKSNNIKPSQ